MESTRGNTHSVTFFPPGNAFFGSMISTMHPLTTNTAAVLRGTGGRLASRYASRAWASSSSCSVSSQPMQASVTDTP